MKRLLIAAAALALLAGCVSNRNLAGKASGTTFVYKPNAPAGGGQKLPVKVAVLPFKDGTEDFTKRGSVFDAENLKINLAKTGIAGIITALPPELWAKALADDMAASGAFRTVRFIYSPSELADEDFYIEGTLEKAYAAGGWTRPSEYALGLRAVRRSDNNPAWEKKVTRELMSRKSDFDGCGASMQCMADRSHAVLNLTMQGMFTEARTDLMAALGYPSGDSAGRDAVGEGTSTPRDTESTEQTIERILKEK
ncbi:MAG: hypothetical protein M0Z38_01965 [Deltaproteobacteria bacterium]|nr:hypothetical protein [Deltaproteobacteria bacterium]